MNNKVCHVANEVRCQSQVEQHVKDIEHHLSGVFSMQIPITCSCQCRDRPVNCSDISVPNTIFFEIWVYCTNPGSFWIRVSVCNQIIYASSKMYSKQGHLRSNRMIRNQDFSGLDDFERKKISVFKWLTEMSFMHRVQK